MWVIFFNLPINLLSGHAVTSRILPQIRYKRRDGSLATKGTSGVQLATDSSKVSWVCRGDAPVLAQRYKMGDGQKATTDKQGAKCKI